MPKIFTTTTFRILFYAALIIVTVMFLIPVPEAANTQINDKLAHLIIFLGLAFLIHFAYPAQKLIVTLTPFLIFYGLLVEVLQGYSGYRMFSLLDWGADIFGIILYISIAMVVMHYSTTGD